MSSYEIEVVRERDISKEFRFTNRVVIDLVKNYTGKNFIVTIKANKIIANRSAIRLVGKTEKIYY